MLTRRRILRTLPLAAGGLWSCEKPTPAPRYRLPKKPLSVVTSTVQAAELVRSIGGEAVTVSSLILPLANPHLWQPVAADYGKLQLADVVFLNGLGLESKFTADIDTLRRGGLFVGVLANSLADTDVLKEPGGNPDPHFWMDPRLWAKAATQVGDVLTEAYPKASLWFSDRAHAYADALEHMHSVAAKEFAEIPAHSRFLFTSHDSMAYFGAAFHLEIRSLASAAGQVPTPFPEDLRAWLSVNNVKTLFREHFADVKNLRAVAQPLNLASDLQIFSLSLDEPGTLIPGLASEMDVGTYLPAFRYTVDIIKGRLAIE